MNILSFGEILWDVFPEKSVIGGAPFNFSAHCVRLGADVDFITAVGRDELGTKTLASIQAQGVSDALVGLSSYPTGVCSVTVDRQGSPCYRLQYDMAYDHIVPNEMQWKKILQEPYQAFYFGTLAQRHAESRATLSRILSQHRFCHVLYDMNIRQNWYDREVLAKSLSACTMLKFSREESGVLVETGLVDTRREDFSETGDYYRALCSAVSRNYDIGMVLLTLDKEGAMLYDARDKRFYDSEKPKSRVVSTVGAGDSFAACFLYHYLKGNSMESCLHKAILLSDYVVRNVEAIPSYPKKLIQQLTS